MSKKKQSSGILPKMEVLIILVFFFSFIIWAASKCNTSAIQEQLTEITGEDEELTANGISEEAALNNTSDDPYGTPLPPANPPAATENPTTSTPSSSTTGTPTLNITDPSNTYSKLFVTIDGLNMRTGPHLDSTIIYKLALFEEVFFLNEVTDSTQKISLGTEIADEPWVRIKHKKGRTGWVYGAGVNYYRKARIPQQSTQ